MKSTTTEPTIDDSLKMPVCVSDASYCACNADTTPIEPQPLSEKHPVISAVTGWWEDVLSTMGNDPNDNATFVERMRQLIDAKLETGERPVCVCLGKTRCGCFTGLLAQCAVAVLTPEVAYKMKRKHNGEEPILAERPFYLPRAFANEPNRIVCVSDNVAMIAKWDYHFGIKVERVIWSREDAFIPLAIAMDYWKDWIRNRLDRYVYATSKRAAEASTSFCEWLFTSPKLSISCSGTEASLPIIIKKEDVCDAINAAELQLDNPNRINIVEMKIDSRAVDVTIMYRGKPVLSHVWERVQE